MFAIWVLLSITPAKQYEMEYYMRSSECVAAARTYNVDSPREIIYTCDIRWVKR